MGLDQMALDKVAISRNGFSRSGNCQKKVDMVDINFQFCIEVRVNTHFYTKQEIKKVNFLSFLLIHHEHIYQHLKMVTRSEDRCRWYEPVDGVML